MNRSMTPPAQISRLKILRHYLPSVPMGLILIMLMLALMAIWLGVSSVTEDTSPVDSTTPKILVQTLPPASLPAPLV